MQVEFPHLNDTNFPSVNDNENLAGVDVYKYENNFDYYRWKNQSSIKLLNVLWNSNYADVPGFENAETRDKWFESETGIVAPLQTLFNNTPKTTVRLPIPYNDAYKYNYVVVDMPLQTGTDFTIDYEDANISKRRWYYFIDDIVQQSPNTTEFLLSVDYWTNYINDVSIPYIMLERGHAPMLKITVDEYLENPLENSEFLLADDYNYQRGESVISTSTYIPIGNGKKYVLFALPFSQSEFAQFTETIYSGNSTPPSYANIDARWGYQLQVNDYEWKYGNTDYSNANLPVNALLSQNDIVPNGNYIFAIEANAASSFFNQMAKNHVNFIHAVRAVFVVAEELFSRGNDFNFKGFTLYSCEMTEVQMSLNFDKNAFGFEDRYREIAKLYTSPYSFLEVTDDNGNRFEVNIENCSNLELHEQAMIMFPFLNYNVFLTGINGSGSFKFDWKNLNDENASKTMWEDDFSKFMFQWAIPTYAINISAEAEYAANNAAGMNARRAGAIKDYQNAVRFANTNRENTVDTMQTNTDNTADSGATSTANMNASTSNAVTNTGVQNTANTTQVNRNNAHNSLQTTEANAKIYADYAQDNSVAAASLATEIDTIMATSVANGVNSLLSGAQSGGISGGALGFATGFVGTQVSSVVAVGKDAAVVNASSKATLAKAEYAVGYESRVNEDLRNTHSDNTTTQNNANMTKINNDKITNDSNAARTQMTNNGNAARSQATETNNATYTRNANIAASKANLVQAQLEAESWYKNARLQRPVMQGDYSGNMFPDAWQRRGLRLNIRTQTKAAIAQAGDAFLRFGYALHRVWNMKDGFHYGKHFTFWKAEDVWVNDGSGAMNLATNTISDILLKGVTVWKNPNEIGKVSIYDNL